jgi:hypothetical protein
VTSEVSSSKSLDVVGEKNGDRDDIELVEATAWPKEDELERVVEEVVELT